jgi:hypothetical protein
MFVLVDKPHLLFHPNPVITAPLDVEVPGVVKNYEPAKSASSSNPGGIRSCQWNVKSNKILIRTPEKAYAGICLEQAK